MVWALPRPEPALATRLLAEGLGGAEAEEGETPSTPERPGGGDCGVGTTVRVKHELTRGAQSHGGELYEHPGACDQHRC